MTKSSNRVSGFQASKPASLNPSGKCITDTRVRQSASGLSGTAQPHICLAAVQQPIQVGKTFFPVVMAGIHINMASPLQNYRFAAPGGSKFKRPLPAGSVVVVCTHQYARECQLLHRYGSKIHQRQWTPITFDVGRCNQQCATHPGQIIFACLIRPMRKGYTAKAVCYQHHLTRQGTNIMLQLCYPALQTRPLPVALLNTLRTGQGSVPV